MLPIADDNSRRRTVPYVTYLLVAVNIVIFIWELMQANPDDVIMRWGAIPAQIAAGQHYETLITSMFLHGGWLHVLGNMLFLWIFGDNVEDALGHVFYIVFYFACGIGAGLAQVLFMPGSTLPSVGASGAISGVLAAYVLMFGGNRVRALIGIFPVVVPAWFMIGVWILIQAINGVASVANTAQTGGVAYGAHLGGFLAGLILVFPLRGLHSVLGGSHRRYA